MFPDEPYELDINSNIVSENASRTQATTKYDLHSAVGRQRPFYYQVMKNFLGSISKSYSCQSIHSCN